MILPNALFISTKGISNPSWNECILGVSQYERGRGLKDLLIHKRCDPEIGVIAPDVQMMRTCHK